MKKVRIGLCVLCSCIFLSSCTHQDPWSVKYIETTARIYYHSADKIGGIDIEMLKTKQQLTTFLQIRSGMINAETAKIIYDDKEYVFTVEKHRGGQRFNVPDEIQALILQLLNENKSFTLKIAGYKEKVEPGNFKKKFKNSNYTIPFHLPF